MKCETNLLQDFDEFKEFLNLIRAERVGSYLEIGSKHGGSLWRVASVLPRGSRIASIDLPKADGSFKNSEPNLKECVNELVRRGYDAHLFLKDSTDARTVDEVGKLAPFDLCFIDGYHTEPFVRADWANYGPMARMVAFHDISWRANGRVSKKAMIDVPMVWDEVKQGKRYLEIKRRPHDYGIGILWR